LDRLNRSIALEEALEERTKRVKSRWIRDAVKECSTTILSQNGLFQEQVVNNVLRIIIEQFELSEDQDSYAIIKKNPLEYRIDGDTGILELDLVDIAMACEEVFGIYIPDHDLEDSGNWKVKIRSI
jgi:acyl carrier protein